MLLLVPSDLAAFRHLYRASPGRPAPRRRHIHIPEQYSGVLMMPHHRSPGESVEVQRLAGQRSKKTPAITLLQQPGGAALIAEPDIPRHWRLDQPTVQVYTFLAQIQS